MKNTAKKFFALVLACLMAFSVMPVAFAANGTDKPTMPSGKGDKYDHLPQIYVTGFQSSNIYFENDPEKKPLFAPIDTNRILGNLKNIDDYLVQSVKNKEPDLLYTVVRSFVNDSFGMLEIMPDGVSSMPGVAVEPTVIAYEGYGKYTFYYDSRLSPVDISHKLDEYIDRVIEDSGSDKIELVGSSYGASVVTAYLHEYKDKLDRVDSVLLCVPSVLGIDFFGELLSGQFNVDTDAFEDFISWLIKSENVSDILNFMNKSGQLDLLLKAVLVPVLREAIYKGLLDACRDFMAPIPAIWTTIPDKYFVPVMKTMFGENYTDPNHEYAVTISKMTYYHNTIKLNAEKIIKDVQDMGKHVSVICKYGAPAIPLSKNGDLMDDGLAPLEITSFGATCARYGKQLPADYTQALYPEKNFISVNRNIDASTCLLPFNTWVLKGLGHGQKNEAYWKLIDEIIYRDLDVFTDENIPQFMQVSDEDAEKLIPLLQEEYPEETTAFQDFFRMILNFITGPLKKLADLVSNLFGNK